MHKKTVGILGSTGYVGRQAVRTIFASTDYNIVLGGRSQEKISHAFPDLGTRGDCLEVDVYYRDQLLDFCSRCDGIVNCAGPSKRIADRVASAAIEQGIHYIDVSGDEHLYSQLAKRKREIEDKKLMCVVSAGIYPGLSEIFPAYAAETYFDDIDSLELFFAGRGAFSQNAAYDIVCSIEEDTGLGMTYCRRGEAKKIEGRFHSRFALPHPAGELDAYPILNEEFRRVAERYGMKRACFYNTYPSKAVLNRFMMIKALEQYKTEEQKEASAKTLAEEFAGEGRGAGDFTMLHLLAKGRVNGRRVALDSTLLGKTDWNALSGIVAANVARLVMEGEHGEFGCFFAAEGVDVVKMMDLLSEQGIVLEHSVRDGEL